ncbi:lig_chan-Glu_bd domain-containing protein [Trichonephila clavata]|uniref:Lig_chan-Glu_bd domain-containing protein n=1 Tax=Trichonephila clavata TaxID=2740835 RepID=A0A8X6LSB4_TRICU|nr:lig_chan-Glu_bd domain-containing protein [Trichonephila clavata]
MAVRCYAKCRSEVLRNFTDVGNDCDDICKPSCRSVRYDISLSKASWPNLNHQQFVMNRSFEQWSHLPEALGLLDAFEYDENTTDFVNDTFFR